MKIFVYGTLKKGGILHKHMEDAKFIRIKKISGFVLYLAPDETYPLLYFTGHKKDVVQGELWKISKKTKHILDKHEEGYILKKLMKLPVLTYYPAFDVRHLCKKIPKNISGKYDFNVAKNFYRGFYDKSSNIEHIKQKPK